MIGLHVLAYNSTEYIDKFFDPWIEFKKNNELLISVGHVCFKEYQEFGYPVLSADGTHEKLRNYHEQGTIDYLDIIEEPLTEAEARTRVLKPLLDQNISCLLITAPDEEFVLTEIENLFKFVERNPFSDWFRINYRNLTFSEKTFTKGFSPPRVFRNNSKWQLSHFFADDEPLYIIDDQLVSYLNLVNQNIPVTIVNPLHYTWLDNERSKEKIK